MARKTTTLTISEGRDRGKTFKLTEPPCMQVDEMIMRAVFGLGRAGVEIPAEIFNLGAAPIAYAIGSQFSKLPSRLGLKLAAELMDCVQRVEDKLDRALVENDIEDVSTRLRLKGEVLKLIFGFFVSAASPNSAGESGASPSEP